MKNIRTMSDQQLITKICPSIIIKTNLNQTLKKTFHLKNKKENLTWQILKEMVKRNNQESLNNNQENNNIPKLIKNLKLKYQNTQQETVIAIYFNQNSNFLESKIINIGTKNASIVDIQTIIKHALTINAQGILLTHNHPQGSIQPSKDDIQTTQQLKQACELMDLTLIDSLIFNETNHLSLNKLKLL